MINTPQGVIINDSYFSDIIITATKSGMLFGGDFHVKKLLCYTFNATISAC